MEEKMNRFLELDEQCPQNCMAEYHELAIELARVMCSDKMDSRGCIQWD